MNLKDILKNKEYCYHFKQYLKDIHATESLHFYMEVEIFRTVNDTRKLARKADKIIEQYIACSSPFEINIDDLMKTAIQDIVEGGIWDHDLFNDAQQSVFNLLELDCLHPFLKSEHAPKKKSLASSFLHLRSSKSKADSMENTKGSRKSVRRFDKYFKVVEANKSATSSPVPTRPKSPVVKQHSLPIGIVIPRPSSPIPINRSINSSYSSSSESLSPPNSPNSWATSPYKGIRLRGDFLQYKKKSSDSSDPENEDLEYFNTKDEKSVENSPTSPLSSHRRPMLEDEPKKLQRRTGNEWGLFSTAYRTPNYLENME